MKKLFSVLGHPLLLLTVFSLLLISGQAFGGFYLVYILNALPHGQPYALAAIAGFILLSLAQIKVGNHRPVTGEILHLTGVLCLLLSLFLFFILDKQRYNVNTFYETIPLLLLIIFLLIAITYFLIHLTRLWRLLRI